MTGQVEEVARHVEGSVQGDGDAAVEAHGRIEDAVEVAEGDAALGLPVDEEAQRVRRVEVEEHADGRALLDAALGALGVHAPVHEPRALPVYVHAPAPVVLACPRDISFLCHWNFNSFNSHNNSLTKHLIAGDVGSRNTDGRISVAVVSVDCDLPVVQTS